MSGIGASSFSVPTNFPALSALPCDAPLAANAAAPQPEAQSHVGADNKAGQ
jgi:hypothetical protein